MEQTIRFEAVDFLPVRLIGLECVVAKGGNARKTWKQFRTDGANEQLQAMPQRVSPQGHQIGWMGDFNAETNTFVEIPGVFMQPETPVPEGFGYRDIPHCLMGICHISGENAERGAHNKAVKAMKAQGYEPDYSLGFTMEYYAPREDGKADFAYYLPCKKKS